MKSKIAITVCVLILAALVIHRLRQREAAEPSSVATAIAPEIEVTATPASDPGDGAPARRAVSTEAAVVPAPAEPQDLTTAEAQITRGDGSAVEMRAIDGEFARLQVEPNEILGIRLALRNLDAGRPVQIDADNGGSINRRLGPLVLVPDPASPELAFSYALGPHRGKYTLLVSQGRRQELLEFSVGPDAPLGQPGPIRSFDSETRKALEDRT